MVRESLLDALDLGADLPLAELIERLREEVEHPDPARRELARLAFERLSESPRAHLREILATIPRMPPTVGRPPRREPPPLAVTLDDLLPRASLEAALGPEDDAERAVWALRDHP